MRKRYYILISAGFLTGLINGLFGAGGGLLLVPFLTYVLKFEQKKAQATSIAVIFALSLVSLMIYANRYANMLQAAIPFVVGGAVGAPLGAFFLRRIPNKLLKRIFALFLIYCGARMLFFR